MRDSGDDLIPGRAELNTAGAPGRPRSTG